MKKLLLLLILSLFSTQGFPASCPDGSEPEKTVSADGSYFEYICVNDSNNETSSDNKTSEDTESSSNQKHNIVVNSQNRDFGNEYYKNEEKGCGKRENQKGEREKEALLYLTGEDFIVKGGTFDCSLQNTIFVKRAKNLILQDVTSSRGSDNPLEIRDSFVLVKNSIFKDSVDNKCVETENGIVIFFNNIFSNCRNGFDMELTSSKFNTINKSFEQFPVELNYSAVVFLENKFLKIRDDAFHCHDRRQNGNGNVYLFLKDNKFSGKAGFTFRKFGKKKDCLKVIKISPELEQAIKSSDLNLSFRIIKDSVHAFE